MNNENTERLLNLIYENPELPVIPFVDGEITCGEDGGWWIASIGYSRVDEYCIFEDRYFFKSEIDDLIDALMCYLPNEKEAKRSAEKLSDWHKAIIVNIDLPEVEEWNT